MKIRELKRRIRDELKKHKVNASLKYPWELSKLRHINYFELMLPGESYCLEEKDNKWEVFFTERGAKFETKVFISETEACEYFYNWIINACFVN